MDRFARGPFHVGYEQRVDLGALRRKRVAKADERPGEPAWTRCWCGRTRRCRYLTDLRAQLIAGKSTALNGALLVAGADPILLCSGGERDRVDRTMPWIKEVHTIPIMEERALVEGLVRDMLVPVLKRYGLDRAQARARRAQRSCSPRRSPRSCPKLDIDDGDTPMQQARHDQAARRRSRCWRRPPRSPTPSPRPRPRRCATASARCEVAAEAMRTLFRLGGEYAHVMTPFVASGEHMAPPHRICSDKMIRHGDIVFIDIGACWSGYFGDVARAVICGKPSRRAEARSTPRCTRRCRPASPGCGRAAPTRTSANARSGAADQYGLGGRFLSLFIAHGVGIGANEPPYIGETLPGAPTYEFQPGMVFAVEPLIWVEGVRGGGGVRLEEMVLVTEDGPHVMSRAPFDDS